jgi:hypothetical protein
MRRDAVELPEAEILAISELQASKPAMMSTQRPAPATTLTSRVLIALLFSTAFVAGSFVWQGRDGFNMGDEGFLWYGVQRVLAGEVPILDFMSYDPGRYYWSAAVMDLFRMHTIIGLRIAGALFQFPGLFVGLLLLLRQKSQIDITFCILVAITLFGWMFNWYKDYDTTISIILVGVLTLLVKQPSHKVFFFTGVSVGLAAVMGRNHGIYGVAGVFGVVIYLACRQRNVKGLVSGLAYCASGVVIGYLPVLIMLLDVPGFASAFWESIRTIIERGSSGLPRPVPWPWLVPFRQLPHTAAATEISVGSFYVAILTFGLLSPLWVLQKTWSRKPIAPEFVAVSMLALPYAHYAFSRPELFHLALGIFPFLIGIFLVATQLSRRMQLAVASLITGASLLIVLPQHPGWNCRVIERCVTMKIGGSTLKIEPLIATFVTNLESTVQEYAPNGQNFLVTPLWPAAYALFNRRSPMWDHHAVFPRGAEFEQKEIDRIKAANPSFALVLDQAVDGREDLRFRNSHPLTYQFIRANFEPIQTSRWPSSIFELYKAR